MNKNKVVFTTFFSLVSSWIGILAVPVLVLVALNLIDYTTGLAASKYRNEPISSYKSFRGIAKKICQWMLVVVAALIDWLLIYAGDTVGVKLPITFLIACAAAIWLICNEIISIIENMKDIGVKIPPFLKPLVKNIKKQVEDKASLKGDGE